MSNNTIKTSKDKVLNVVLISGISVPANQAVGQTGQYYFKWNDLKTFTDRADIMIPTNFVDGKPANYRKTIASGGKYAWCETTKKWENVLDGGFTNVFCDNKYIWLTTEAASCFPYYWKSKDGRDWQNGYTSMQKNYFTDNHPPQVKICLINGELIDIPSLGINSTDSKLITEKWIDNGNGNNPYYKYFRKNYSEFNTGLYGQQDNPAFEKAQQTGDTFFKQNPKEFAVKIAKYEKYLAGFSVGVEVEAFSGFIPEETCFELGIIPVKDGSLDGSSYEYISTVLREGVLSRLYIIFKELNKYLAVNKSCALQYHIGGFSRTPESIVALYKACYQLKNDFFQLIPPYRTSLEYMKTKKEIKDHCKPLPGFDFFDKKVNNPVDLDNHVKYCYKTIVNFLNEGEDPSKGRVTDWVHRKSGKPKWEWTTRYYMVNFLPTLFETKRTVEFRPHSGTTNPYKALNFLLILIALLKYVEKHKDLINSNKTKLCFLDIIEDSYGEDVELMIYLEEYIKARKEEYQRLYITNNIYGNEFTKDTEYRFTTVKKINIYE